MSAIPSKLPASASTPPDRGLRSLNLRTRLRAFADSREDQEFLPAHLEILDTPPSPFALGMTWAICALFASALLWSCLARIDIYAVASGRVQPNGRSKVVQPLETSRVKAILTENGAHVVAGTPLIQLDATLASADLDDKRSNLASREAQAARFKATIDAVQANTAGLSDEGAGTIDPGVQVQERVAMQADIGQYFSTRQSLLAQIAEKVATQSRLAASIAARERLQGVLRERATMKQLLESHLAGTHAAVLDAMQQVEQASADLAFDQGQLAETQAAAVSLQRHVEQWKSESLAKHSQALADAIEKRDAAGQDVVKARYHLAQTQLVSPIEGTVQQLAVTSVGQVVSAGQPLLVVVPSDGAITIEALVPNKDVGFIEPGQDAVIKIDAFPFTRYGTVDGTVDRISRDAIDMHDASATDAVSLAKGQGIGAAAGTPATQNLVFPVTIRLDQSTIVSDGRAVRLTPGMTASVEIRTGARRVIDYLLAPIRETSSTAGHER